MDRISDSGSDGLGSNPDGSTKNAFVGIYRPYRGKKRGKVLQKTLPVLILWCFMSLAVARETIDLSGLKRFLKDKLLIFNNLSGNTCSFMDKYQCFA